MRRAAKAIARAWRDSDACPILLENTAGTSGPLGRDFEELRELIDLLDGDERVGICLDCCHLFASGYDIPTPSRWPRSSTSSTGSSASTGSSCSTSTTRRSRSAAMRDRHAVLGEGELGPKGLAAFLSEPRFEDLPALLETGGPDGKLGAREVAEARKLRKRGLAARRRKSR